MRIAAFLMLFPGIAAAQTAQTNNDLEYRQTDVGTDKKLEVSGQFETQWHEYDNLDFRKLDETSDQAILDSDDRNSFAFTGAALNLGYQPDPKVRFVLGASHRGLWGTDQFGGTNVFGGWVYFNAAYVDLKTSEGDNPILFRVGRQFYKIGGVGGAPDFVLADVLDMVRVDIPIGTIGKIILVPINVTSSAQTEDGANFARFIGQSSIETFGFRGDRMTRRHGAIVDLTDLGPAHVQAYGFYSDIGALGTGSDISYDGLLGNFSDNDWVANVGVRGEATFGPVTPFLAIDGSFGIDRKELVASDADTNGYAGMVGVTVDTKDDDTGDGLDATAYFYYSLGPTFGADGLIRSHGYVGMKAQQVGGLIANRYMGWHPGSYVDLFGVDDSPHDLDRKSGTWVATAEVEYERGPIYGSLGWWTIGDTGYSQVDFQTLNTITPPFGYSREEFAAQVRHGRLLAHEIDLLVGGHATDRVDVYGAGAFMLPGEFYSIEISRIAGDQLGSADPQSPWAAMAGLRVRL
ncbi:MAG: hypothetical protein H6737_20820 [Alphaproteobacteria bacterium]|nr:hypothetical protein [Alphaproteobacteria bacterium]